LFSDVAELKLITNKAEAK
jgi:uncharacterized protein (DUF3084 family)